MDYKFNIMKILPKWIYRFNAISTKRKKTTHKDFVDKDISKIYMESYRL